MKKRKIYVLLSGFLLIVIGSVFGFVAANYSPQVLGETIISTNENPQPTQTPANNDVQPDGYNPGRTWVQTGNIRVVSNPSPTLAPTQAPVGNSNDISQGNSQSTPAPCQ